MTDQKSHDSGRRGWDALFKLLETVRYRGPEPRPSPEEEERMVAEMVRKERRDRESKTVAS